MTRQNLVYYLSALAILLLIVQGFLIWDFYTMRLSQCEKRIAALELKARPLFIVERFSNVYLRGEELELEKNGDPEALKRYHHGNPDAPFIEPGEIHRPSKVRSKN